MKHEHHVFSARTTREGLKLLRRIRFERNLSWHDVVLHAVCAHYGLDREVMALTRGIVRLRIRGPRRGQARLRNMLTLSTKKRPRIFSTGPVLPLVERVVQ